MSEPDEFARLAAERDQRIAGYIDAASEMFQLYRAYIDAGFTADQAMQMLTTLLMQARDD